MPILIESITTEYNNNINKYQQEMFVSINGYNLTLMLYDISNNIVICDKDNNIFRIKTLIQALELSKAILLVNLFGYNITTDSSDNDINIPLWVKEV